MRRSLLTIAECFALAGCHPDVVLELQDTTGGLGGSTAGGAGGSVAASTTSGSTSSGTGNSAGATSGTTSGEQGSTSTTSGGEASCGPQVDCDGETCSA
ncbi:MAG TPA: hypothetical protein VMB91_04050, partial [Solirubrobacteraceae bacterium]|nr:hypothetical protein [Solirubrobacteraceae bacterium]